MLQVISGVPPVGFELNPTQLWIGPFRSALPGLAGKVGQSLETLNALSLLVVFSKP